MVTAQGRLEQARTFRDDISRATPWARSVKGPTEGETKIWNRIEEAFNDHRGMETRMDASMDLHMMKAWEPTLTESIKPKHAYTSNRDGVLSRKVTFNIASSIPIIRVVDDDAHEDRSDANNLTEHFCIGALNAADDLLKARAEPSVLDQLAGLTPVRGEHVVVRAILDKDEEGETIVEMVPMDPRNFVLWRTRHGIKACAYRHERTRDEIKDLYPDFVFDNEPDGSEDSERDLKDKVVYYDYYFREVVTEKRNVPSFRPISDGNGSEVMLEEPREEQRQRITHMNGVLIQERWAKEPADTNAPKFPVVVRAVGSMPQLATKHPAGSDQVTDMFGEDVFVLTKDTTRHVNEAVSLALAAADQQVDRAYKLMSQDGSLGVPKKNPLSAGAATSLSAAANQDIVPFPPADIGNAPQFAAGITMQDWDAGGLTALSRGQMPPTGASGVALQLVGSNISERSRPFLMAIESAIEGGLVAVTAQYETGLYEPLKVRGITRTGEMFADMEIPPEAMKGHGRISVELAEQLPQDQQQAVATAFQLAQPVFANGESLADPKYIREHHLKMQDSDLISRRQQLDQVKTMAPVLLLKDRREDAARRGEEETVAYLDMEIESLTTQKQLEWLMVAFKKMQLAGAGSLEELMAVIMGPQQGQPTNGASPGGISGQVSNVENRQPGTVGRNPSPTAGGNATNARPGAQSDETARLAAIGLVPG